MNKKKLLSKLVVASVLVGGINFLPVSNMVVENFQISVAHAENKTFAAKDAAMTDVEIIEAQAKEASRLRAIEALKEQIAAYVRNFSGVKGKLSEDDITTIAENFEEVGATQYKKLFYNAVDENGNELGKVGIMYEATVTAKFNSKKITEYIKLNAKEKEKRIRQAREAREKFKELDREYEELRKNARNKTPEQLQSEIKNFDDKLSDLEKRKDKKSVTPQDRPAPNENKPTPPENKPVTNQPMQFSQPVKIGIIYDSPVARGIGMNNSVSNIGKVVGTYKIGVKEKDTLYDNGIAQFGNNDNAIYVHYAIGTKPYFGDKDKNNTFQIDIGLYGENIFLINNNSKIKFYILQNQEVMAGYTNFICLGKREDGKFVKYFETNDLLKQYFGIIQHRKGHYVEKIYCKGDSIIVEYKQWEDYGKVKGEFKFKWDEKAQWFSVEQIKY